MPVRHRERHRTDRIGWLRAAVLGANDGIVSTASLVLGVAAAHARNQPAQDREEHERCSGDDRDQTRLRGHGNGQQRQGRVDGEAGR